MEHLAGCTRPCLLISGIDDFVHDPDVARRLMEFAGPAVRFERIQGADHFFRGQEPPLVQRILRFIDEHSA
jgi:alpha/beta superfamily hydrolase